MELLEGSESLFVIRPVVGPLKPLAPRRLLAFRQVAHYVFTFVPLAALYQGPFTECLFYRRLKALSPSMITSRPSEISSPRSSRERRNGVNTCAFSVSVSTKPKKSIGKIKVR